MRKKLKFLRQLLFLLKNEFKKLYSGSVLGILWFFLNPILYTLIYFFLFEHILQIKFTFEIESASYFKYLIIGLILWNSFVTGLLRGSVSLIESAYILKKVYINPIYFPIIYALVPFLQGFIFLLFLLLFYKVYNPVHLLFYLISSFNFLCFLLGSVLSLAALTVYIRDIPIILNNVMNFLFYTIPIIYPYEYIPRGLKELVYLNPLLYIFKPFHDIIFYKKLNIEFLIFSLFISTLIFIIGILIFEKLKQGFYDVL